MNSATGTRRDDTTDDEINGRRRAMRLVTRNIGGKALRIEIADDLLGTGQRWERPTRKANKKPESSRPDHEEPSEALTKANADSGKISPSAGVGFVFAAAAAAGLMVGYLAGSRRNR